MSISRLYNFAPNTTIVSAEVDSELDQLVAEVNLKVKKDGSEAFTGAVTMQSTLLVQGAVTMQSTLLTQGAITSQAAITAQGDVTIQKSSPALVFDGGEASAVDFRVRENAGILRIEKNDASAQYLDIDVSGTAFVKCYTDLRPSAAGKALGSATLPWKELNVDNGATDGGAVYFDAGTTKFLKANAAGTVLDCGGFTSIHSTTLQNICQGMARWNGSTGAIIDSFNVLSIVRNATGDYTINWDVDFTAAPFLALAASQLGTDPPILYIDSEAASNVILHCEDDVGTDEDASGTCIAFGELVS